MSSVQGSLSRQSSFCWQGTQSGIGAPPPHIPSGWQLSLSVHALLSSQLVPAGDCTQTRSMVSHVLQAPQMPMTVGSQ